VIENPENKKQPYYCFLLHGEDSKLNRKQWDQLCSKYYSPNFSISGQKKSS